MSEPEKGLPVTLELPGENWQEAVEHMANLIRKWIDEDIVKKVIQDAEKEEKESDKTIG